MPKIKYDKKDKILSIKFSKNRSVDSDVQDNVVIDYDKNGDIVAIDIMPVSVSEFSSAQQKLAQIVSK